MGNIKVNGEGVSVRLKWATDNFIDVPVFNQDFFISDSAGKNYTVEVTALEGYRITKITAIEADGTSYPINTDGYFGSENWVTISNTGRLTLNVITVNEAPPPPPLGRIKVNGSNIGCTFVGRKTGTEYAVNDFNVEFTIPSNETYDVNIYALEGYQIVNGTLVETDGTETSIDVGFGGQTASITFVSLNVNYLTTINVTTINSQPKPPDVSGFNKVYSVDAQILSSVSSERFINPSVEGMQPVDLGNFIVNVLELPFPIPTELIGTKTPQLRL